MNNTNQTTDSILIDKFKSSGDHKHLAELFSQYIELIYGLGLKYLKNSSDAEDLVMNMYEQLANKLKVHQVENFNSWLYVVTKNQCYEKLRRESRIVPKENEARRMYSDQVFHLDSISKEETLNKLENCMEALDLQQKMCLKSFYFDAMSYKYIAEAQNIPWNKVRSLIQNGRRMLKNCIEKND